MAKHMTKQEKLNKQKARFTTKIVVCAVLATTLFTIGCFWLAVYNIDHLSDVSLPTELTTLFFAFWTVEIVMLATLDRTKIKNKYHKEENDATETDES
jgi:uncharacterized Tic20 family protein